jgi:hypothetical protein
VKTKEVIMGNVIEKYLCYKPPVDDLTLHKNNNNGIETKDTTSTASFENYMSSREISAHPKLLRRYHSFKKISINNG